MKDTKQVEPLLSAYLDGELSADQRELVAQALQASPELRRELAELRATRDLVRGLPRHPLEESVADEVLRRTERATLLTSLNAGKPRRRWLAWGTAIGSAAAAGIVALVLLSSQHEELQVAQAPTPKREAPSAASESRAGWGTRAATATPSAERNDADTRSEKLGLEVDARTTTVRTAGDTGRDTRLDAAKPMFDSGAAGAAAAPESGTATLGKGGTQFGKYDAKSKEAGQPGRAMLESNVTLVQRAKDLNAQEIVGALNTTDVGQVTCVVGNREEGLSKIRTLFARNGITVEAAADDFERDGYRPKRSNEDGEAFFVEATSDRLESTVAELRNDANFLEIQVETAVPESLAEKLSLQYQAAPGAAEENTARKQSVLEDESIGKKTLSKPRSEPTRADSETKPKTAPSPALRQRAYAKPPAPAAAGKLSPAQTPPADQSDKATRRLERENLSRQAGAAATDKQQLGEQLGQTAVSNRAYVVQLPLGGQVEQKQVDRAKPQAQPAAQQLRLRLQEPKSEAPMKQTFEFQPKGDGPSAVKPLQVLLLIRQGEPGQPPPAQKAKE